METEKPVWTTDHISTLLCEMRNNIPLKMRKIKWTKAVKALDWKEIAFEPFSPEECQQKWQEILQTINKVRTFPELVVAAEDCISDPSWSNTINPEYPKPPPFAHKLFYKENLAELKKKYPNAPQSKLLQYAVNKYKMLPEEEKEKYKENYKLAKEEYERQVVEFRKRHKEEAVPKLQGDSCTKGFSLFCREQRALIGDVSRSGCQIKWTTRWQNLTESQKNEYGRRSKQMENDKKEKNDKEEKNDKDSLLLHKPPQSGYSLFRHEQRGLVGDVPVTNHPAVGRQCWRNLSETQKNEYKRRWKEMKSEHAIRLHEFLQDLDVRKQEQILKKYNLKRPELPKEEKRKAVAKFPGEPKRPPCGAHVMFFTEQVRHLKEIKKATHRLSIVSQMWRNLSKNEKASYKKKLEERVRQYSVELQRWFKTLTPKDKAQYLKANPSRHDYLWGANTLVYDKELSKYQPSDSEDEDLEDSSSSEDDVVTVEDEEEEDNNVMFDMF